MTAPLRLWTDDAAKRFYLVPEDVPLGAGALELRAGIRHSLADPAAVAPYEVSREEARAFLHASAGRIARDARDGLFANLGLTPFPPAEPPAPEGAPGPGVRLFADLARDTPERIAEDPQAFLDAFARMMRGAGEKLSAALRTPEGKQEMRESLRGLGDTLRRHGISAEPAADGGAETDPPQSDGAARPGAEPPPSTSTHEGAPADDGIPASPELESLVAQLERAVAERRKGG